ncbi:MAG: class I SAM-dependent methyltransferase [Marinilabiliaceae bacterium]|nr:class I SAM-dependent methyltransferase [Marinilabiliaceae bacterium]
MNLSPAVEKTYTKETLKAPEAQTLAHFIAFAPVIFQVARLMIKFGVFEELSNAQNGLTIDEVANKCKLSHYAAQVLLEASLSSRTVYVDRDNKFHLAKTGWFLLRDKAVQANLNFNHDVNYLGLFDLEAALLNGKPEGLKVFGSWNTIYEGLSQLPEEVQKSWFGFDHFYSDNSFDEALKIAFQHNPKRLLDIGGNTGRWAEQCVKYDKNVRVTIMDLPQQLEMMRKATAANPDAARIDSYGADLLKPETAFPEGFDAIWMSQFLDCFSEEQVISILTRAAKAMSDATTLYVMETFWNRQQFEPAALSLTLTSPYFTAMANGNSKMFLSDDFERLVAAAGLKVKAFHDNIGYGHTIVEIVK